MRPRICFHFVLCGTPLAQLSRSEPGKGSENSMLKQNSKHWEKHEKVTKKH